MPLKRLKIRDFQAHADTRIEFSPGVTTLVGSSDVGKSAVIRALRWVTLNAARGKEFIRHGAEQAAVHLWVDGFSLLRGRGKKNLYHLTTRKPGGDEGEPPQQATYEAMAGAVPEDIANRLRVGPLNFQRQHDPPFWLAETPGAVAQEINKIVDLDVIDVVLKKIGQEDRNAKNTLKASEAELAQNTLLAESLEWVVDFADDVEQLVAAEEKAKTLWDTVDELRGLVARCRSRHTAAKAAQHKAEQLRAAAAAAEQVVQAQAAARAANAALADFRAMHLAWVAAAGRADALCELARTADTKFKTTLKKEGCPLCERPF